MKLIPFDYQESLVRVCEKDGGPWFVAKDVCAVLGIVNHRHAVHGRPDRENSTGLDDDERGVASVTTPSGMQEMTIISESGLYALIFKSRKPEAKAFRKWVTSEVLPALRKTGNYSLGEEKGLPEVPRLTVLQFLNAVAPGVWRMSHASQIGQIARKWSHNLGCPPRRGPDETLGEHCRMFPLPVLSAAYRSVRAECAHFYGQTDLPVLLTREEVMPVTEN